MPRLAERLFKTEVPVDGEVSRFHCPVEDRQDHWAIMVPKELQVNDLQERRVKGGLAGVVYAKMLAQPMTISVSNGDESDPKVTKLVSGPIHFDIPFRLS